MGDSRNIKVTFPEDLAIAELILENRKIAAKTPRTPRKTRIKIKTKKSRKAKNH
jgi:hypothetical protein